jgi:hypothetical protein
MQLKTMIENLSQSVIDIEDLANKLETEIIEWNTHEKLNRRD